MVQRGAGRAHSARGGRILGVLAMITDAITCPSCSAADRSTADRHGVHVCEYCGVRYRVRHGEAHALEPVAAASPWRSPPVLLAIAAAVALGVVIGKSTGDAGPRVASEPAAASVAPDAGPVPAPPPAPSPLASLDPLVAPFYTPPPPPPADAAAVGFVLDGTRSGYGGSLYVLGRVTNASTFPVQSPVVTVVLLDEHDREVGVDKGYVQAPVLEAGASAPISILLRDPPAHARMMFEVQARPVDPTAKLPAVRIVDPIAAPPREGTGWSFRGRIANDGDVPLRFTRVSIFGFSADGRALGEQTTYASVELLGPGQSARWVAQCDDYGETPVRFEYVARGDFVR